MLFHSLATLIKDLKKMRYTFHMTYGYIRVSTDKQTIENQRFEINNFCNRGGIKIDGWIEETISGTKNYNKRQLGKLLNKVQKGDLIICSELSRLGRNLFMIMEILSICMNKECKIWTIKDNYRLGDDIQSKVLAFAFGQTLFRHHPTPRRYIANAWLLPSSNGLSQQSK